MEKFLKRAKRKYREGLSFLRQIDVNTMLLARLHVERVRQLEPGSSLRDTEFKVFSQFGEDGIIQFLISKIPIENPVFIEFGVESYIEANTRFLLRNDNWKGLIIDGSAENVDRIRGDNQTYAKHDLTAVCQFITRDNINQIFEKTGFSGDIGLLSVDVDGNDYWIWEAIHTVSPRIVICEYNSGFGSETAITVPYDPLFERFKAHYSGLYYGASLPALCMLADAKGYDFVGSNSMGMNAFFIRKDLDHGMRKLTAREGYVGSTHRMNARNIHGNLSYIGNSEGIALIQKLPVVDVRTGKTSRIEECVQTSSQLA